MYRKRVLHRSPLPRGFTLLELLVVIGIIVLLAAIGYPAISAMMGRGKNVQCMTHLKNWASAIQAYAADNNNQVYWYPHNDRNIPPTNEDSWVSQGGPYRRYFGTDFGKAPALIAKYRQCPADGPNTVGYAFVRPRYDNGHGGVGSRLPPGQLLRLHSLREPSNFLLMTDAWDRSPGADGYIEAGGGAAGIERKIKPICEGTDGQKVRHAGKVHVLFADFHIGTHTYEDFRKNQNQWMVLQGVQR